MSRIANKQLLLGSCFSENIGEKLDYFKFKNSQNPFGILFHPKAIETLISNAVEGEKYTDSWLAFNDRLYTVTESRNIIP